MEVNRAVPPAVAVGCALLASPAAAHGTNAASVGLAFPVVVAGSVVASLLGGGLVLGAYRRAGRLGCGTALSHGPVVCVLLLSLGTLAVWLAATRGVAAAFGGAVVGAGAVSAARGHALTDCGTCADATLGAVTLHRVLEGGVLATVYAADAALGLFGAVVLAGHAAAETAAVGSLYAVVGRLHAVGAVATIQVGFVLGTIAGAGVVGAMPGSLRAGVLGLVGGVLLAVGASEGYHRYAREPTPLPT